MSASDHLGGQFAPPAGAFYHGTPAKLRPGDLIQPATAIGIESSAPSAGNPADHAYMSTTRRQASYYAKPRLDPMDAVGRQLDGEPAHSIWQGHVYQVKPTGPIEHDTSEPDSYHSAQPLRVVRRVWSRFDAQGNPGRQPDLTTRW